MEIAGYAGTDESMEASGIYSIEENDKGQRAEGEGWQVKNQ